MKQSNYWNWFLYRLNSDTTVCLKPVRPSKRSDGSSNSGNNPCSQFVGIHTTFYWTAREGFTTRSVCCELKTCYLIVRTGPKTLPLIGNIHQIPKDKAYLKCVYRPCLPDCPCRKPLTNLSDLMSGRKNMAQFTPSKWPLIRPLSLPIGAW